MKFKSILFGLLFFVLFSFAYAVECSQIEDISDCINTPTCTVIDDGSGCVADDTPDVGADYCNFQQITDCINTVGCTVSGNGNGCVVATASEMKTNTPLKNMHIQQGMYVFEAAGNFEIYIDGVKAEIKSKGYVGGAITFGYQVKYVPGKIMHGYAKANDKVYAAFWYDISQYANIEYPMCNDSDDGENFYVTGTGYWEGGYNLGGVGFGDYCENNILIEHYCNDKQYYITRYRCIAGCQEGKCLSITEEPETEIHTSSMTCPEKQCKDITTQCSNKDEITVKECQVYISKQNKCESITISESEIKEGICSEPKTGICQGCQYSANSCIPYGTRIRVTGIGYYCDFDKSLKEQKENKLTCQNSYECTSNNCKNICTPICEGCLDERNLCIPIATRTETQFCDIDTKIKDLKIEKSLCQNNYECVTNLCVDGTCIEKGFFQKIMSWFGKLFGG